MLWNEIIRAFSFPSLRGRKDCKSFTISPVSFQCLWLWSGTVKKFFEGISISQIIAGSLAAITSFFLAGKIGVAGSTIGAAASYIISTVAGKVYQNVLKASGEKLQAASPLGGSSSESEGAASDQSKQAEQAESAAGDQTTAAADAEKATSTEDTADMSSLEQPRTVVSNGALSPAGSDGKVQTFAQVRHRNVKRMAIVVSLISGLVGVALTAGVVLLFTQGKGTDTVVRDMTGKSSVVETPNDGADQNTQDTTTPDSNQYGTDDHKPRNGYGTDSPYDSKNPTEQNGSGTNSNSGTSSNKGTNSNSGNSNSSGNSTNQNGNSGSGNSGNSGSGNSNDSGSSNGSNGSGNSTNSGGTGTGGTGPNSSGTDSSTSSGTGTDSSGSTSSN